MVALIALAAYGYELFNINLTIDEELAALRTEINPGFIPSGRWGLFVLTKLLLPKQVIPFVPLALTLLFHLLSLLLLLDCLGVRNQADKIFITALAILWSGLVFIYSFSPINFSIGFGFLCISLSLYLLLKGKGAGKLWAAIPIAFVIPFTSRFCSLL